MVIDEHAEEFHKHLCSVRVLELADGGNYGGYGEMPLAVMVCLRKERDGCPKDHFSGWMMSPCWSSRQKIA